jgi:hypothetical protein
MSLSPLEFRITVNTNHDVIAVWRGAPTPKSIRLDALTGQTIETFIRWLEEGKITRRDELELLGTYLYSALFRDKIHDQFAEAIGAAGKQQPLRVVLVFAREARELAVWPWEYLYRPDDENGKGCFIAAESSLILTRHVDIKTSHNTWAKGDDEIRILAVVSRPKGMTKVNAEPALRILNGLRDKFPDKVKVELLDQPTKVSFNKALQNLEPHIVHFIGHGKFEQGHGKLCFVDQTVQTDDWIDDETFSDAFSKNTPRLVFLQACEGAETDYKAFSGVALQLVFNRVPAVIAMRYEVTNRVASAFTETFYRELSQNRPIDEAVQIGRRALGIYLERGNFASRNFGCPVIYLQSFDTGDHVVLSFPTKPAEPDTRPIDYLCPRPTCRAPVNKDRTICQLCRQQYSLCPGCGITYSVAAGFCDGCGWGLSEASAASPAPDVLRALSSRDVALAARAAPSPVAPGQMVGGPRGNNPWEES